MNIAAHIDHTILKATTSIADIQKLCNEAIEYQFAAVCVPPCYVTHCKILLKDSKIKLATVIGFPFGYQDVAVKVLETSTAIEHGAQEIDVVINLAALKNGNWNYLENEISMISAITEKAQVCLKVIIESGILTDAEIIACCELYNEYPIQYLKTSTGYAEKGATKEAVRLFKKYLKESILIKASGGIRTKEDAETYLSLGAERLGCSASVAIVNS